MFVKYSDIEKNARLLTTSKHNFALNNYLDIYVEKWAQPMPACRRYGQVKKTTQRTRADQRTTKEIL